MPIDDGDDGRVNDEEKEIENWMAKDRRNGKMK